MEYTPEQIIDMWDSNHSLTLAKLSRRTGWTIKELTILVLS